MFDILSIIPGKKRLTPSGWYSFNAICCTSLGHRQDKRGRGGIKLDGNNWTYHCFNCNFTCNFELGRPIGQKTTDLLKYAGIDDQEIKRWSLESLQHKDLLDFTVKYEKEKTFNFTLKNLPECESIDVHNPDHKIFVDYLVKRKIDFNKYTFYVTPKEEGRNSKRIIIPYFYKNKIVGHTSRYLDDRIPKYINDQQPGYVFNYDMQKSNYEVCILVEGIFDALSIDGCALTHNTINDDQAKLLKQLYKRVIFVPDRDKTGLESIDKALEVGYSVSLPNWADDVKDVNDAVVKYGKLPTLISILQNATSSKIKIEMQRKKLVKRI
jgi:hypothetical protein